MSVTDLTGTKWKFNSSVTQPASDGWVKVSDSYIEDSQNRFYSDNNKRYIVLHNASGFFGAFTSSTSVYYGRPGIFNWSGSWRKATSEASSSETNAVGDVILYIGQCDNTQSYYQNFVQWVQLNATKIIDGYSITYHANGGTPEPENLAGQTNLPSPLPTISKPNFTFDGWYTDSTFTTPAVAGAEISADTDLYAKFTRSHITLDLSTIGLPEGTHSIQMKLSDDGITKADSELSNEVSYTVAPQG